MYVGGANGRYRSYKLVENLERDEMDYILPRIVSNK